MKSLKNWDNKTWISSKNYIKSFNKFLIQNTKLNSRSDILDIGCGRGKILGDLSNRLKLKSKPIGIDIENHKDKDKRIEFKKLDSLNFFKKNKKEFDLILIKQTIHLLKIKEIIKLIKLCEKYLTNNGVIIVFTLDPDINEIPTFKLMNNKLKKSLNRDKKIIALLKKNNKDSKTKKFVYKVKISKKKYLQMIRDRYISTLLNFSNKQIEDGLNEINLEHRNNLIFKDRLICLKLKK